MFFFLVKLFGKISAQPHTIVKQICFPNGNLLFLSLFSLSKNWMHNVVWGCAEILPIIHTSRYNLSIRLLGKAVKCHGENKVEELAWLDSIGCHYVNNLSKLWISVILVKDIVEPSLTCQVTSGSSLYCSWAQVF